MTIYERRWTSAGGTPKVAYRYDFTVRGKRYKGTANSCTSKRMAEAFERQVMTSVLEGTYELEKEKQGPGCPTLEAFAPVYLAACSGVGSRSSAREVKTKKAVLDRYLIPFFGGTRLVDITTEQIDAFMDAQKSAQKPKGGCGFSIKTITNHVTVLSGLLRHATAHVERMPTIRWPRLVKPLPRYYTFEEAERLIEASKAEPFWSSMILVALKCGLRVGELQALQWRQVDLRRRTITVDQTFSKLDLKAPKNGRARVIDLAPSVVEALSRHPRRLNSPWVWPSEDGDALKQNEVKHPMWRALDRAGLPADQWHICRHTFCSHLVMRGVHLATVMQLAGHSSYEMTLRYAHLAPHVHQAAVAMLDTPSVEQSAPPKRRKTARG